MDSACAAELVVPGPNDEALRTLLHKLGLLALRNLLTADLPTAGESRTLRRFQASLHRWFECDPAAAQSVQSLDVLCPLLASGSGAVTPDVALAMAVPNLMVRLSHVRFPRSALGLYWNVAVERLVDEQRGGVIDLHPPAVDLALTSTVFEARLPGGRLLRPLLDEGRGTGVATTRPFHPIVPELPSLTLSVFDSNPLAAREAHPEKSGNAIDLGGHSIDKWRSALSQALDMIRVALPALYREMAWSLRRIVPVGYEPEQHLSASYREAPGLVYMTLHPNPLTLAEALIHESQHGKLNALSFFDPILHNARSEWTRSPVRPDLRPLMGVLLAAHAFIPVALLHSRLHAIGHDVSRTESFARRRAQVISVNDEALQVLAEKGQPTPIGRSIIEGLASVRRDALQAAGR